MNKKRLLTKKTVFVVLSGICLLLLTAFFVTRTSSAIDKENAPIARGSKILNDPNLPKEVDIRNQTAKATKSRRAKTLAPTLNQVQTKAVESLKNSIGDNPKIVYNSLTATPRQIVADGKYLTAPSKDAPESIAREFLRRYQEIFRFDDSDLANLKLKSRATTAEGTTIMLFEQTINNVPVYHGEVLVNVAKTGEIMSVGGDSFPRLSVTNAAKISAAQAVSNAADDLKIFNFSPQSLGETKILATYGNLPKEYASGERFAKGDAFGADIDVQQTIFPLGEKARLAYKFNLVTPQYYGIMWQNIVDAETGEVLKRLSLTAFDNEPGGGVGANRRGTFRPDVQNMVESYYQANGARGKLFDTVPATLSGFGGAGRTARTGNPGSYLYTAPAYNAETPLTNHFRYSLYLARNENPLFFTNTAGQTFSQTEFPGVLGQVVRGLPDAARPTASSPFGWFYLPTDTGGAEITTGNANRAATRVAGYTMSAGDVARNLPENSPTGDKTQPFSADTTPLGRSVTLADGRVLNSVIQSRYAEGNNVTVSDDRANDNDSTRGVRAFSQNRQFVDPRFDYFANYELGGTDATGGGTGSTTPVSYPASADSDVYAGAINLFWFNNVEHDYLYSIGFTEQFWNFQFDNFGKGAAGSDAIVAEVQDGSGTDNANMSTPADGSSPRMQMYLFTDNGFRRSDGDFDWDVVAHEQYHGVSNRSASKGGDSALGTPLVGESGGMGEGWSDFVATSMSDDDSEGENVTGEGDVAIRRLPYTNYRYSYAAITGTTLNVRRNGETVGTADANPTAIPFEVHDIGELWAATLWDMRELMIVKQKVGGAFPGVFFDGNRRFGGGSQFYIGERLVNSIDAQHPINYRVGFNTSTVPTTGAARATINAVEHIVRPGLVAAEIASGNFQRRSGPLSTAVSNGARLADKITLRALQLTAPNPSFVTMRNDLILADREITGGENVAVIWRAFASHGVGQNAASPNGGTTGSAAPVVEDFTVPATVTACEQSGPLAAPTFSLSNTTANTVTVTISAAANAQDYVIQRGEAANGAFTTVATTAATTYQDQNLTLGKTYFYQVHARRNSDCVGSANTNSIAVAVGTAPIAAPIFAGLSSVGDPRTGRNLTLNWAAATSANPNANIVYDVYRVTNIELDNDTTAPTFAPSDANRIATGITGTSFTNNALTLGQQYYYIVRARDTNNNTVDTDNAGNTVTRFNAPTSSIVVSTPFQLETFENATANARFLPNLIESATPDNSLAAFQRVPNATLSSAQAVSAVTYAPDFDPGNAQQGGASNFATITQLTNLTRGSILEFDHRYTTEAAFDGGNLEIVLGSPSVNPVDATPFPNNVTTFDLNDYLIEGGYSNRLDGTLAAGAILSPLQGRLSFTGTKALTHVRAALGDFRAGGVRNPNGLPVFLRFHMSSDAASFAGTGSGWFIDNLVVNNFNAPTAAAISIGGRVAANQTGVARAVVTLVDNAGAVRQTVTNSFGNFRFDNVSAGGTYIINVSHKRYSFAAQTLAPLDTVTNLTFAAE